MPVDLPAPYQTQNDWAYSETDSRGNGPLKILFVGNFLGTTAPLEVPLSVLESSELLKFWSPQIELKCEVRVGTSVTTVTLLYRPTKIESLLHPVSGCTLSADQVDAQVSTKEVSAVFEGVASGWQTTQDAIRVALEAKDQGTGGNSIDSLAPVLVPIAQGLKSFGALSRGKKNEVYLDQLFVELEELRAQVQVAVTADVVFQEMKRSWLGLDRIITAGSGRRELEVWALNASLPALAEDCAVDVANTDLHSAIYQSEIGQYGGEPFSSVAFGFQVPFTKSHADLYRYLATIAEVASVPVLVDPGLSLLNADNYSSLDGLQNIAIEHDATLLDIAERTCGSFLFLTPQSSVISLDRDLEKHAAGGSRTTTGDCSGSVDLVIHLFKRLTGKGAAPSGFQQDSLGYQANPVYWFGPTIVDSLRARGMVVPLCHHPAEPVEFTGALPVAALRSTAKGRGAGEVQKPPELIGLVHILRILHKLKAWARESIGSSMSINERVAAINEQIGAYVLDTPKPRVELLQSRPLSSGRCEYVSGSTTTLDSYRLSFCLHKNLDYPVGELTTDIAMG